MSWFGLLKGKKKDPEAVVSNDNKEVEIEILSIKQAIKLVDESSRLYTWSDSYKQADFGRDKQLSINISSFNKKVKQVRKLICLVLEHQDAISINNRKFSKAYVGVNFFKDFENALENMIENLSKLRNLCDNVLYAEKDSFRNGLTGGSDHDKQYELNFHKDMLDLISKISETFEQLRIIKGFERELKQKIHQRVSQAA